MTLDELEQRLEGMQQEILNITPILTEIGQELTTELRTSATAQFGSGPLSGSIRVTITPESLSVLMNDYGAYQNYGVRGVNNQTMQSNVEDGVSLRPSSGSRYSFKYGVISRDSGLPFAVRRSIAQKGLNKRPWFSVADLTEQVTERLQQRINQAFE